jgi:hypothetical protein
MRRIFLCLLLLVFPVTGCYSQQQDSAKQAQKPRDPYTWDFGQVKKGTVLKHDFTLKNESDKVLNILSVNTSCGCTVSKVQKKKLLPQEQTLIEVKFNTKGYSGPVQQYVYVNTDSLDNPVIKYIIKAELVK